MPNFEIGGEKRIYRHLSESVRTALLSSLVPITDFGERRRPAGTPYFDARSG